MVSAGTPSDDAGDDQEEPNKRCYCTLSLKTEFRKMVEGNELRAILQGRVELSGVHVDLGTPQSYAAVVMESDSLSAMGVGVGDTLIVDAMAPPAHGKVVCAIHEGKIAAFIYAPPYVLPQSVNAAWRPLPVDQVQIVGVVKQQLRSFA